MQVLSSLSGIPFYAPSAAYAPTNGADVSAIASAYADPKLDATASSQFLTSTAGLVGTGDLTAYAYESSNSAKLDTTAFSTVSSKFLTAVPAGYATTAYVDSSVSSKLDSTASSQFITALPADVVYSADITAFAYESSNSAKLDTTAFSTVSGDFLTAVPAGYATTAYVDSSVSSKLDATASSQFITSTAGLATTADISGFAYESSVSAWTAKQDALTFGYDTANNISSIDGSAIGGQGGGGGIDSATCSAIASAYAESAVSSVSGNYYPATSNPSGYLTSQAQASWSESASASPSYIVDKPDLVDIVAGPGIVVDNPDGNTLRVSMAADYDTVLWEGSGTSGTTMNLSETTKNFDRIRLYAHESYRGRGLIYEHNPSTVVNNDTRSFCIMMPDCIIASDWFGWYYTQLTYDSTAATSLTNDGGNQIFMQYASRTWSTNNGRYLIVDKIVGINRTASAQ